MKFRKSQSSRKEKKSKKVILEKLDLEKEVNKPEITEDKKEIQKDEFIEELDANGIISAGELNQILRSQTKLNQLENLPVRASLEGGLIFAPRMKERKDAEGKIYKNMNYDPKYSEARYSEKTPGVYVEKVASSGKESPKDSDTNGISNGNP